MRSTVCGCYINFGLMSLGLDVRFGSKGDMCAAKRYVRFTPNSDRKSVFLLLDHLVCTPDQCVRNIEAE
jgi:hypothetical protein